VTPGAMQYPSVSQLGAVTLRPGDYDPENGNVRLATGGGYTLSNLRADYVPNPPTATGVGYDRRNA
jgi:hypothetical protein